jgi:hypothetical protein
MVKRMEKVQKGLNLVVAPRLGFLTSRLVCVMTCITVSIVPSVALAAHEWCNNTNGKNSIYAFKWQPEGDVGEGVMLIKSIKTNKVVQKLEGRRYDYYNEEKAEEDGVVELLDLNFDGCLDILWEENSGASGNTTYATFLFNQSIGAFQVSEPLSEISELGIFDVKKKCLSSYRHMGSEEAGGEVYCWVKGKLVQTEVIYTKFNRRKDCFLHKRYLLQGRKTKLTSRKCTRESNWSR